MKSKPMTFIQSQNLTAEIFVQGEMTWTPALLATAIRAATMTGAFKDDAAIVDFTRTTLTEYRKEQHED